jgi:hypothetical protein
VAAPVTTPAGVHLLALAERAPARSPAFEEVRSQVESELRRRRSDEALRALLVELRRRIPVTRAAELPLPGAPGS